MWQDLRFGFRMWARQPGLTLVVVLTLALGVGANTSLFSVINAVLLRPLAFDAPERLVRVWGVNEERVKQAGDAGRTDYGVSPNDFLDWKAESRAFELLVAYGSGAVALVDSTGSAQVRSGSVSPEFFRMLGVTPVLGRFFETDADGKPEDKVIVLSESLWRRHFGADPSVLGRTVLLAGAPNTIIGVAPLGLEPPIVEQRGAPDLWHPRSLSAPPAMRGVRWISVLGRLRPGVTVAQAQEELDALNERLAKDFPSTNTGWGARVMPLADAIVQEVRPALLLLLGAVGFVLLIATANVANLLIARSVTRQRELAIRSALGASRGRLIRQLLLESLMVALLGGALGLLLSLWLTDLLVALGGEGLPRMRQVRMDGQVLAFTLAVSLATGLLFGVLPAIQARGSRGEAPPERGARRPRAARRPGPASSWLRAK